jgi:hypothetical protein
MKLKPGYEQVRVVADVVIGDDWPIPSGGVSIAA